MNEGLRYARSPHHTIWRNIEKDEGRRSAVTNPHSEAGHRHLAPGGGFQVGRGTACDGLCERRENKAQA
jgi:hypothetical protein